MTVLALVTVLVAAPSAAAARSLPAVLTPAAADQFPEGVAWDPSRRALLEGSLTAPARITAVGADGVARTVVTDPDLPGFAGMKVDARRHRIVAVYGNPAAPGPTGVAIYDLATGRRERLVDLRGDAPRGANDLALDPRGTAYVTDSLAGAVYRVDVAGHVSTLVSDPRLLPAIGANGIVWHRGGFLVVVNYTTGRLFRIDLRHPVLTEVRLATPLVGGDGMALREDGTLIVVTNALGAVPGSRAAVHELALVGGGRVAVPLRDRAWPDPAPTTVAVTPFGDYVLDGRIDRLLAGTGAADFVLRRI
jgi:sugar lactone lactonase YvrE